MKEKVLKIWYIIAGCFGGIAILYYLVLLGYSLFSDEVLPGLFDTLNIIAIIFLLIALIMLLLAAPLVNYLSKKENLEKSKKVDEEKLLEKYKSKKKKED